MCASAPAADEQRDCPSVLVDGTGLPRLPSRAVRLVGVTMTAVSSHYPPASSAPSSADHSSYRQLAAVRARPRAPPRRGIRPTPHLAIVGQIRGVPPILVVHRAYGSGYRTVRGSNSSRTTGTGRMSRGFFEKHRGTRAGVRRRLLLEPPRGRRHRFVREILLGAEPSSRLCTVAIPSEGRAPATTVGRVLQSAFVSRTYPLNNPHVVFLSSSEQLRWSLTGFVATFLDAAPREPPPDLDRSHGFHGSPTRRTTVVSAAARQGTPVMVCRAMAPCANRRGSACRPRYLHRPEHGDQAVEQDKSAVAVSATAGRLT